MSVESANSEASKLRLKIKVLVVSYPLTFITQDSSTRLYKLTVLFDCRLEAKKAARKVEGRLE